MKRICTLIIVLTSLIIPKAEAQLFNRVSISAGKSWSTQSNPFINSTISDRDYILPGFNVILNMTGKLNDLLSFTTDIGYIQKGYRYVVEHKSIYRQPTTYQQTLHYITYSHQLKIGHQIGKFIPTILLGPRIDYLLAYEGKQNIDTQAGHYPKSTFGFNMGMDITYVAGKIGFTALCQYQFDFTTLQKNYSDSGVAYKNQAILVNMGVVYLIDN